MKDVKEVHQRLCPQFRSVLDLSLDGIQESKSSSLSADVYSVSFKGCRMVYPIKIIRTFNKYKIDEQAEFQKVINDINENNLTTETAVGDNLKRSFMRCALCSGASFACEYCESKAHYIENKNSAGKKCKGHLAWPSSTANGPPRTIEKIIEITNKIDNGEQLNRDEAKGFWGTSHLLHQEGFHFINDIPAEYMHSSCLGVSKRLIELTFNVGESRDRNTKRKLSDASAYNRQISEIQVFRECSRRLRNLDFGVMKAQEFRNVNLFFFGIVLNCIPVKFNKERKLWLQFTYILRACVLPNDEFDEISDATINNIAQSFYKNFESVYGKKNCSYSIHVTASHFLKIRGNQPLTEKSAFKFENFYSELKNLFQPGTTSPSKQIIKNCFMKRLLDNHCCEKSIYYDVEKSGRENNYMIYQFDENKEYQFFNIIKKIDNNNFLCNPQGRFTDNCPITSDLDWDKVGVFSQGPFSTEEILIERKNIHGKVMKVQNYLITCPNNVLREQ